MASAAIESAPTRMPERSAPGRLGPAWLVGILLVLYFASAALAGTQSPCGNDLGGVFIPSARYVVGGQPLDMYMVRAGISGPYPNANGPLGEILLGGGLAIGRIFHLEKIEPRCGNPDPYPAPGDSIAMRIWLSALFAIFPLLIAREALRVADRWWRPPLAGWPRLLVWGMLLLAPSIWDSLIYYGHLEQSVELWLALLAVRWFTERRLALSGIFLGLALLNRTAAIFVVIPLFLLLVRDRRWLHIVLFGIALGGTLALGLGPFWLHDKQDVVYSLLTFRSQLAIGDGSFWTFFRYTKLEASVQNLDSIVGLAAAAIVSAIALWVGRVREDEPAFYGVIALAVVWFSLSIKAIWGYYFYEPQTWAMIWALTLPGIRRRWFFALGTVLAFSITLGLTEGRISISSPYFNDMGQTRQEILLLSGATAILLLAIEIGMLLLILFRRYLESATVGATEKSGGTPSPIRMVST